MRHFWCAIHRVCTKCGVRQYDVMTNKRDADCPGGPDGNVRGISHLIAEAKWKRQQDAYSKGRPA